MRDQVFVNSSGRKIGFSIYGKYPSEKTIVYFHGFPGSRIEGLLSHEFADDAGVSIVALDRSGIGLSEYFDSRTFTSVAQDYLDVLNFLGTNKFSIIGVSGGTPYALALCLLGRERIIKCSIISGTAPFTEPDLLCGMNFANRLLIQLGLFSKSISRSVVWGIGHAWRGVPGLAKLWFSLLIPKADLSIMKRPRVAAVFSRNVEEALKQGVRGVCDDFNLMTSPWQIKIEDIQVPTEIWHGDQDDYVPLSAGEYLRDKIPNSKFKVVSGGGHFILVDLIKEAISEAGF